MMTGSIGWISLCSIRFEGAGKLGAQKLGIGWEVAMMTRVSDNAMCEGDMKELKSLLLVFLQMNFYLPRMAISKRWVR